MLGGGGGTSQVRGVRGGSGGASQGITTFYSDVTYILRVGGLGVMVRMEEQVVSLVVVKVVEAMVMEEVEVVSLVSSTTK